MRRIYECCECFLKWLLYVFVVVSILTCHDLESKAEGIFNVLKVDIFLDKYEYTIEWQEREREGHTEYYLHLPCVAKEQGKARIRFDGPESIVLNGRKLSSGAELTCLQEGENIIVSGENTYNLNVFYGSNIPVLHVVTESGNLGQLVWEKDYRESGTATFMQSGTVVSSNELEYIKGRGNSTWKLDKKPFNIKFKEKVSLFGMERARKWCLLANYLDDTLLKNKVISDFAEVIGLNYTPQAILVDLYINDQYMGNYTLMERVEIGDGRVDITDLEKLNEKANPDIDLKEAAAYGERGRESYSITGSYKWADVPNLPEIVTGGYLLEFELAAKYDSEASGFVSEYGQPVIIKSPEYAAKEQVEYIKNYYQEFENAVLNGDGYNDKGKHFSDYIDLESFAKMYVFQEFIKNLDAGITSCFFYKEVGGKLAAGPAWDFDSALGRDFGRDGVDMKDPVGLWVTGGHLHDELKDKYTIFSLLCRHNQFREEAQKQWKKYFAPNVEKLLANVEELSEINSSSIISDSWKWEDISDIKYEEMAALKQQNMDTLIGFIEERAAYMSEIFSDETCTIAYNSNGGTGSMYDLTFYEAGSEVELQKNIFQIDGREFLGWNTKISGFGESYEDGAVVVLDETVTLYAQWSNPTTKEKIQKVILGIIGK